MVSLGGVADSTNIDEPSSATSRTMIALRLGVGFAAALVRTFFFQAGPAEGVLFPDLSLVGLANVQPGCRNEDALRAMVAALAASRVTLIATILAAANEVAASADSLNAAWNSPLSRYSPNGNLSELVVWRFSVGQVQTFVPFLLAKSGPTCRRSEPNRAFDVVLWSR